jgi:F-type H+-transporting ATPase subunit delta
MTSAVASRYARAFADVIMAPGVELSPAAAIAQLRSLEDLLAQSEDLRHALSSPAVRGAQKRALMSRFAGDLGVSPLVRNFLFVLIDHRRIALLAEMREAFEAEIDQRLGYARAEVVSAQALDRQQTESVEASLTQMTGKQVRAQYQVDPSLIGGAVARVGSTVYDGSIRGQLENMRRRIAEHTAAGF